MTDRDRLRFYLAIAALAVIAMVQFALVGLGLAGWFSHH
ncbi:hypothetical protein ACVINH_006867 [Rhizobium anhuiense]